jgi:succinate dehydrogenase/fumarate reductase flavoprotein subunit
LAKAVVLAAGGCGTLYPISTYPKDIAADGFGMGFNTGAEFVDMEFMQFEPCCLVQPDVVKGQGISTTLLVEGGELFNNEGTPLVPRSYPGERPKIQKGELSRLIHKEVSEGRGTTHGGVFLDVTGVPRETVVVNHAIFYNPAKKAGIDLTRDRAEVAPGAHTLIGGLKINPKCETTIAGLYAAGEVVGGLHGANRLGGNAGTETLVFGALAGIQAAQAALAQESINRSAWEGLLSEKRTVVEQLLVATSEGSGFVAFKDEIQYIVQNKLGIIKDESSVKNAISELAALEEDRPRLKAKELGELVDVFNIEHLLTTARLIAAAAMERRESRGVHYRADFPKADDYHWMKKITVQKSYGDIKISLIDL